jgi:hypothetical protein
MKRLFSTFIVIGAFIAADAQTIISVFTLTAQSPKVVMTGTAGEAAFLTSNGKKMTALSELVISQVQDSVIAEQIIMSAAACPSIKTIRFEGCHFSGISGAIRMLTTVENMALIQCPELNTDQAFGLFSEMQNLHSLYYESATISYLPKSFGRLRLLHTIELVNQDLSLADGYNLNTKNKAELYKTDSLALGFGTDVLRLKYSCYDLNLGKQHLDVMRDLLQGVVGAKNQFKSNNLSSSFNKKHPLVKPPFVGLDVRRNLYQIHAQNGGRFMYPSGTQVLIPRNAFVDAQGNPVNGNVTIDYREFRDQVDILVSGIPMKYDSAGKVGDFESAGMFEMNASVNGQEVFLAEGKSIGVEFAVVDTAGSYNFYELDPKKGWVYKEKPGELYSIESNNTDQKKIYSDAAYLYNFYLSNRRVSSGKITDLTLFDQRYADTGYYFTNRKGRPFYTGKKVKPWRYAYITLRKTKTDKDHVLFLIQDVPNRYDRYTNKHDELSALRSVQWRLDGSYKGTSFNKLFGKRRGINDFRIKYLGGNDFVLEIKDLQGFQELAVVPVRLNNQGKEEELNTKDCNRLYRQYFRQLNNRKKRHDRAIVYEQRKLAKQKTKRKQQTRADSVRIWNNVKSSMSTDEKNFDFNQWNQYVRDYKENQMKERNASEASIATMVRSLSIDGFGIYNCDQIRQLENPVEVFALVEDANGKRIRTSQIYVIDRKVNAVLSYSENGKSGSTLIAYSPSSDNRMMCEDKGVLYVGKSAAFGQERPNYGSIRTFTLDAVPTGQTVGDLRTILLSNESQ